MKKTTLITDISGKSEAYLAQFLLTKNYQVIDEDRRSVKNNKCRFRNLGLENKIKIVNIDLTN